MPVVDELVTLLGVKLAADAISKLTSFKNSVQDVSKQLAGLGLVVTGALTAAGLFINHTVNQAAELDKLSQKTGLSAESLQEWGYAAQQAGGSAQGIHGDLQRLQQKFMGTGKTAEQSLLNMADSFKNLSASQATMRGKAFGLSDDTILLLRKGREGVEALKKEAHKLGGIIPNESIKRAAEFKTSLSELQFAIKGITAQVALATLPALEKIVSAFKSFIEVNQEWIRLGLEALFQGMVNGVERFFDLLRQGAGIFDPLITAVKTFLPEMEGAEFVTHLVTGALTGLMVILAPLLAKLLLVSAAVFAVSMVFEDLFTYIEGGDSTIGHLFDAFEERWPALFAAIQKVGKWFKEHIIDIINVAVDIVKGLGKAWMELITLMIDRLDAFAGPVSEFFETFETKFPALSKALSAFSDLVKKVLVAAFDALVATLKAVIKTIMDVVGGIGKAIGKVAEFGEWVSSSLGFGDDTKTAAATAGGAVPSGNTTSSQYNDNKTVTIHVATNDALQAGEQVLQALNQSNINTPGQFAPVSH